MSLETKFRNLNIGEKYACNKNDAIARFLNSDIITKNDIFINFGYLGRNHEFDSKDNKHPKIKGNVIVSSSVNKRDGVFPTTNFLSFYVIRDTEYNDAKRELFVSAFLPQVYDWFVEVFERPITATPGVEKLLVEYYENEFIIHEYRYH